MTKGGEVLGWAVVVERRLAGDARFGDLRVGMIADCLALPEDAGEIVHAAFEHLRARLEPVLTPLPDPRPWARTG